MRATTLRLGDRTYDIEHRALVMGVLAVPPTGGVAGAGAADGLLRDADSLVADGADLLEVDVDGGSVTPAVPTGDALAALAGLVARVAVPVAVVVASQEAAFAALDAGASMVGGPALAVDAEGAPDPAVLAAATACRAAVALAPSGRPPTGAAPGTGPEGPTPAGDLDGLLRTAGRVRAAGIPPGSVVLDLGTDRATSWGAAVALVRASGRLADGGHPVLLSSEALSVFDGSGRDADGPAVDGGPLGATSLGVVLGCRIVRVRAVAAHRQVCAVLAALEATPVR